MRIAPISIAPMMDWTDRHDRYFLRLISRQVLLYTEMITTAALLHGDRARLLAHDAAEHPLALQLGGSTPQDLALCARMGEEAGHCEINLNCGCPSDRVQEGRFGACLMAEPERVGECVAAMKAAVQVPVTVKTRIGIDDRDSFEELLHFVATLKAAGVDGLIVHARKAWLSGLSPKENREIPPLCYDVVHRLKTAFADLPLAINGGITTLDQAAAQLTHVDGVMIGRAAYHNPWLLAEVDGRFYGDLAASRSREEVLDAFGDYMATQQAAGVRIHAMTRHILGLYAGLPGARHFRRIISERSHRAEDGATLLREALAEMRARAGADDSAGGA